jgi:hypothetical protein
MLYNKEMNIFRCVCLNKEYITILCIKTCGSASRSYTNWSDLSYIYSTAVATVVI